MSLNVHLTTYHDMLLYDNQICRYIDKLLGRYIAYVEIFRYYYNVMLIGRVRYFTKSLNMHLTTFLFTLSVL